MHSKHKRMLFVMGVAVIGIIVALAVGRMAKDPEVPKQDLSSGADIMQQKAKMIVTGMDDEALVGQLLIAGFSGLEPDYYIKRMIELRHFGGVILFSRNVESVNQVMQLTQTLQEMAKESGNLPLWVCVDEEGGIVRRMNGIVEAETNPPELARMQDPAYTQELATAVGHELKAMGINVNFAPVLDIGFAKGIMGERAFGKESSEVSAQGVALINGYAAGGVLSAAKHFPGLGRAMQDPHGEPVVIAESREVLADDLKPFQAAIKAKVDMVMVSHALYPAYDPNNVASMSSLIQTDLLRKSLGFDGLIVADDIEMGAALAKGTVGDVAVAMLQAGADQLLICHTPEKQAEVYDGILAALARGELKRERLETSVERIVLAKLAMGLE